MFYLKHMYTVITKNLNNTIQNSISKYSIPMVYCTTILMISYRSCVVLARSSWEPVWEGPLRHRVVMQKKQRKRMKKHSKPLTSDSKSAATTTATTSNSQHSPQVSHKRKKVCATYKNRQKTAKFDASTHVAGESDGYPSAIDKDDSLSCRCDLKHQKQRVSEFVCACLRVSVCVCVS